MQFIHSDLGHRSQGEQVQFMLSGNSASCRLIDSSNFSSYRIFGNDTMTIVEVNVLKSGGKK